MKLTIALAAASIVLHWTTPGAGTFYVFTADRVNEGNVRIVAAGYEAVGCHWSLRVAADEAMGVYWTAFVPGPVPAVAAGGE